MCPDSVISQAGQFLIGGFFFFFVLVGSYFTHFEELIVAAKISTSDTVMGICMSQVVFPTHFVAKHKKACPCVSYLMDRC